MFGVCSSLLVAPKETGDGGVTGGSGRGLGAAARA